MRAYRELRHLSNPIYLSHIKEVHSYNQPSYLLGIFSGNGWRHKSMGKTIDHVTDPKLYNELKSHASENLKSWKEEKVEPPNKVEVVCKDFGDAALEVTKKHGKIYPILNMANSLFPGGAALEGGSAQEENMWHRSSCVRSLLSKGIYYDGTRKCFLYDEQSRRLLSAQEKMSPEELESLSIRRGIKVPEAYKVYMDDEPQICFRGPEILVPTSSEELVSRKQFTADSALSYSFLPKNKIFPFYELRAAAPELIDRKIDFKDEHSVKEYTQDLSRRIGAQLDTLILKGKTDAIMGAWGCGSFKNDPEIVAKIYCEEIGKRAQHFQHIVFPIIDIENGPNFQVFKKHLDGVKLGNLATQSSSKTPLEPNPYGMYAQAHKKGAVKEESSNSWNCTIL
ncbi:poly(ADP-ribose) glycohydrolase domain-containing protein [Legionella sp. WA2022007384]